MTGDTAEKVNHPLFARIYMRMSAGRRDDEERGYRRRLLSGLSGRVIEVGAGNGLNFELYPPEVMRVLAVEPEPLLREAAREEAAGAPVEIEVVDGVAGELPADEGSQDAAVASLVLCSVPDQGRALEEMRRVVKPGGELRFYEHVVSRRGGLRRFQRFSDATYWPRIGGGCHMARDTLSAIEAAGFEVESVDRFPYSPSWIVPSLPHILGRARRA